MVDYDNFFLPVADLETAKNFYKQTLGLETKFDFSDKGMTAFKIGQNEPAIILSSMQHAKPAIWFKVDSVIDAYHALAQKGVVFLSEPFEIMTGLAVEFNDPCGNRLGLTDYSKTK
ncbi:MAG: lactoylglutathione lyase [Bacteroidetes bacterium 43-16]|nr:MAG: lactoylglutathione lyase [Bacteroidetes bacterium 43-16]